MGLFMDIISSNNNDTLGRTLENLKDCSKFKRIPKERLKMITFLEKFQSTVTYDEAILLNNLRQMPFTLYIEQKKIYNKINNIFYQKEIFYKNLQDLLKK